MSDMPRLLESPEFSSFCIFAPELGSDDEEASLLERSQELLYFFPDGMPVEDKLFHVGTCKTALSVMRDFGPSQGGVPARTATICLARRRISLREVEPGVWAALVVVAGAFDSRPPVDGQEMGASAAMQPSTPHTPHLAPTGSRTAAADFHHVTSEGDAQSLIDTVYRRARMLVGGVWGGLGGAPGRKLLAAVTELARQQRRCLSKAGRAAEREAASPARDPADGPLPGDEASMVRRARAAQAAWDAATSASPLRQLRQRLRRAVTWCLWCVDARRWSVVDARDGPTPCPVDRTAMPLVVQATEALRGCFIGVDSVTLLWQGSVVVRGQLEGWAESTRLRGRLSALIHVREGACDWAPASGTVLPSSSVLELCQRVVSTLTALEEPLSAALDLGVRAAERRSLTDSLVQRHVDEGSVGVFGALRAAPTASGGVGSDDAEDCGGAADVPANYNSPGELERATLRVSAAPDNAVSTARPSEVAIRATAPSRFSRFERMEMTRYHGGAVVRAEGFREVLLVHSTVTPTHAKATQRAKDLLGPRFRNLYV